jgi:steroid 5-alpha reductase family enzyme
MWKYSRYPNCELPLLIDGSLFVAYALLPSLTITADFGELLTWWSIYFGSMSALLAPVAAEAAMIPWAPLVGLLSPAFITLLLLKVSGIPLLEAKYKKEYKGNVGYQDYVRRTPLIVPNPFVRSKKDD